MKKVLSILMVMIHFSAWSQINYEKKIANYERYQQDELQLADIDGDSDMDFVILNAGYLLIGRNFSEKFNVLDSITKTYVGLSDLHCLDLDQDGDMDIITSSTSLNLTYWWENDGKANFTKHTLFNMRMKDFLVADLNQDGAQEIIMKYNNHITAYKLVDDHLEQYLQIMQISDLYLGTMQQFLIQPGTSPGILVCDAFEGVLLLSQDELGVFHKSCLIPQAISQNKVFGFDADQDGYGDIFTFSNAYKTLRYFRNNGDNTFSEKTLPVIQGEVGDVLQGDYDGDGDQDFMIKHFKSITSSSLVILNNKNNFFTREIIDADQANIDLKVIAKINRDEAPDLCVYNEDKNNIQVYLNTSSPLKTISDPNVAMQVSPTLIQNQFQINADGPFEYNIYNLNGAMISNGNAIDTYAPDATNWQSGMYLIQVKSKGVMKTFKVLKA